MTQEEKQLLIKDLCARVPYSVKVQVNSYKGTFDGTLISVSTKLFYTGQGLEATLGEAWIEETDEALWLDCGSFKPYLRPMSSMTEEEKKEYDKLFTTLTSKDCNFGKWLSSENDCKLIDFYNFHHFDYRGLIPMGLALEAPEGMYKTE